MPKRKTKKPPDLKSFLIAKLRSASRKWPPMYEVKNKQKRYVIVDIDKGTIEIEKTGVLLYLSDYKDCKIKKSGRRVMYVCQQCGGYFFDKIWTRATTGRWIKKSWVALDHVEPVVPVSGWDSWDGYIDRMFNGSVQLLCTDCHKIKSEEENGERRTIRNEKAGKGVKKDSGRKRNNGSASVAARKSRRS